MSSIKWEAGSDSTILTTELDSFAPDQDAITADIDNSTNLYIYDDVELYINAFDTTPGIGSTVQLYIIRGQLDGSGFEDGGSGTIPSSNNLVGVFNIRTSDINPQLHILRQIPIPPGHFKYVIVSKVTGAYFDTGSNTLRRKPYRYQVV
jgi:hypothetical protein